MILLHYKMTHFGPLSFPQGIDRCTSKHFAFSLNEHFISGIHRKKLAGTLQVRTWAFM
jgi:hypothetical protein